jgi:hypothetical protein
MFFLLFESFFDLKQLKYYISIIYIMKKIYNF